MSLFAPNKWALSARIFHWLSAILLVTTWAIIEFTDNTNLHKVFGVCVLFWVIARIINRFLTKAPADVSMPKWQTAIAHLTHFALYGLMLAMPLLGLFSSMYRGYGVDFGIFELTPFVAEDRALSRTLMNWHKGTVWTMLLVMTAIHIGGALFHQFVKKDRLINRML